MNTTEGKDPNVSVVVPTYRRPDVIGGCLRALHKQTRPPLEVLVCYRETDELSRETLAAIDSHDKRLVREIVIGANDNFKRALGAGISASRGDLVALTDDDAEAPNDWIERLSKIFEDDRVAAAGGRDVLPHPPQTYAPVVGKVQWFGRVIGNHHLGSGPAREVDIVKGVNCCFRGDLLRRVGVDDRLRGSGTVIHTEMSMCLPLRREGWLAIYDPSITVDHHVAVRADGDNNDRGVLNPAALADSVHNETLMLLEHLSTPGKAAFVAWALLAGKRKTPGFANALRLVLTSGHPLADCRRFIATMQGRGRGFWTWLHIPSASRTGLGPLTRTGRAET